MPPVNLLPGQPGANRLPFRRARVNQAAMALAKMKESSLARLAGRLYCGYMVAPESFAR